MNEIMKNYRKLCEACRYSFKNIIFRFLKVNDLTKIEFIELELTNDKTLISKVKPEWVIEENQRYYGIFKKSEINQIIKEKFYISNEFLASIGSNLLTHNINKKEYQQLMEQLNIININLITKSAETKKGKVSKPVEAEKPAAKLVVTTPKPVETVSKSNQSEADKFLKEMEKKYADELVAKTQSPSAVGRETKKASEDKTIETTKVEDKNLDLTKVDVTKPLTRVEATVITEAKKIQEISISEANTKVQENKNNKRIFFLFLTLMLISILFFSFSLGLMLNKKDISDFLKPWNQEEQKLYRNYELAHKDIKNIIYNSGMPLSCVTTEYEDFDQKILGQNDIYFLSKFIIGGATSCGLKGEIEYYFYWGVDITKPTVDLGIVNSKETAREKLDIILKREGNSVLVEDSQKNSFITTGIKNEGFFGVNKYIYSVE